MTEYIERKKIVSLLERLRDKCGDEKMAFAFNWAIKCVQNYLPDITLPDEYGQLVDADLRRETPTIIPRRNRAQLRGKPLDPWCKSARTTTNEYGLEDKRVFCLGRLDLMTEDPLEICVDCGAFIRNITPPDGCANK